MAEAVQQNQTLSLRISEALRKRLDEIRKLTAIRKGENVSTSEIAKQLLESAREERLEVVELLTEPTQSLAKIRRKGQAGQMLSRAEWTVVAYFAQQGAEGFHKNPLSRETFLSILKAFEAVYELRAKPSEQDHYYLSHLPSECRPERTGTGEVTPEMVRGTVAETVRRMSDPRARWRFSMLMTFPGERGALYPMSPYPMISEFRALLAGLPKLERLETWDGERFLG